MAIPNFPDSPSSGDFYTYKTMTWKYDGVYWKLVNGGFGNDLLSEFYDVDFSTPPVSGDKLVYNGHKFIPKQTYKVRPNFSFGFHVSKSSNDTNVGNLITVSFDTVDYDPHKLWSADENCYICPVNGLYWFSGSFLAGTITAGQAFYTYVYLYRNNSWHRHELIEGFKHSNTTPLGYNAEYGGGGFVFEPLNAGDKVYFKANLGNAPDTLYGSGSFFSGGLIEAF